MGLVVSFTKGFDNVILIFFVKENLKKESCTESFTTSGCTPSI